MCPAAVSSAGPARPWLTRPGIPVTAAGWVVGLVVTALTVFNDCITREAFARGLPLIDLRLLCDQKEDYANPIEPSVRGGEKIAAAIARLVAEHDFSRRHSEVFSHP